VKYESAEETVRHREQQSKERISYFRPLAGATTFQGRKKGEGKVDDLAPPKKGAKKIVFCCKGTNAGLRKGT